MSEDVPVGIEEMPFVEVPADHIYKLCTKKKQYTKKQAEGRIKHARKMGKIISPNLKVYKCNFCWAYHIGHERSSV